MPEPPRDTPVESVHSAAASAHISHAVIATYAAAAAIEVEGVHAIAGAQAGGVDPDRAPKGVRIVADGDAVGLELHLVTEWGASIPRVAGDVSRHVRDYLGSMIELEPSSVAVVVDDVSPPPP
ncbi:MAG: Asp23 family, cell envelope-related function [Gaiellales bacterium]|jgi:uncharacterized alkaline shock family protein YloU|nr:Asp23 family, cell envelope-related function [Gaiellales bacterium]